MRAFVAVDLPEGLRREAAALQARFRSAGADVKWVEPENLHLTLKFLGSIEETQVSPLTERLKAAAGSLSSFTLRLEGIGAFPRTTDPRVIWVGVSEGKEKLAELASAVEQTCAELGFPKEERPFSPHLTIGRIRSRDHPAGLIKKLQVAEFCGETPAPVNQVILYQSTLSPQGPLYTPLAQIPLG